MALRFTGRLLQQTSSGIRIQELKGCLYIMLCFSVLHHDLELQLQAYPTVSLLLAGFLVLFGS